MIKDQDALESWMRIRAAKRHAAEMTARWEARRPAKAASADWIATHRPHAGSGQSFIGEAYAPMAEPKIIRSAR